MNKRCKEIFYKRGYTGDKLAYGKMPYVTCNQEVQFKTVMRCHCIRIRMANNQNTETPNADKYAEQ